MNTLNPSSGAYSLLLYFVPHQLMTHKITVYDIFCVGLLKKCAHIEQGRSQKFFFGGYQSFFGRIKPLNSRSDVIFTP